MSDRINAAKYFIPRIESIFPEHGEFEPRSIIYSHIDISIKPEVDRIINEIMKLLLECGRYEYSRPGKSYYHYKRVKYMNNRITGYKGDYPTSDNDIMNLFVGEILKSNNSDINVDSILHDNGWRLPDMERRRIRLLFNKSGIINETITGNLDNPTFYLKDEYYFEISKACSFLEWIENVKPKEEFELKNDFLRALMTKPISDCFSHEEVAKLANLDLVIVWAFCKIMNKQYIDYGKSTITLRPEGKLKMITGGFKKNEGLPFISNIDNSININGDAKGNFNTGNDNNQVLNK